MDPAGSLDALAVTSEVGEGEDEEHVRGCSDSTAHLVERSESVVFDDDTSTSSDGG